MKPEKRVKKMLRESKPKPVTDMKDKAELASIHSLEVEMASLLLEHLKGNASQLIDQALLNVHGKNRGDYGDTYMPRLRRYAKEALESLCGKIEQIEESDAPDQAIPLDDINRIRVALDAKEGRMFYDLIVNNQRILTFKADSQKDAEASVKKLKLQNAQVQRVTKGELQGRQIAYNCSPESEAYWSS